MKDKYIKDLINLAKIAVWLIVVAASVGLGLGIAAGISKYAYTQISGNLK